ncbi:MAG: VWA domain-containing protein [Nitriliruptor sp.]|uniref:VWA domain-containing protein n=1 Tax=Nitriliruptor sp. TaxID=2448056 RepID=UPI0034A0682E
MAEGGIDAEPGSLTGSVVGFARTLRAAGVDASPDRVHACLGALGTLGAVDPRAVYWAGRLTLCSGPDDLERYDRVFAAFFDGLTVTGRPVVRRRVELGPQAIGDSVGTSDDDAVPEVDAHAVTRHASREELLRHRDVRDLDDQERRDLHRLLAAFAMPGATRRTRRSDPARRGAIDRRRSVRALLRSGGELGRLHHRAPREQPRRVVLLVDISGSMAGYADVLLRFAHVAARRQGTPTEVFTLGTRLTRVTEPMSHRDPDTAMRAVAAAIPDWSGGTRLGEGLRQFLDLWGQRGFARGAVVVVLSDGWETGEVTLLGEQVARLSRLAHRVIWANPLAGREGFAPIAGGMAAALPHCDALVEGHSLAALERLAHEVAGTVGPQRGGVTTRGAVPRGAGGSPRA